MNLASNWARKLSNLLAGKSRIAFSYADGKRTHSDEYDMALVYSSPDVVRQHLERFGYQQVTVRPTPEQD